MSARHFTSEEYETVSERVEIKVEYLDGQIVPKEGLDPLPEWVVDGLLQSNYSLTTLNYEFPMASMKHDNIVMNLVYELLAALGREKYMIYGQSPKIYISLSGKYRIPDVTVAPRPEAQVHEKDGVVNPIVVIEVLSPSNRGEEFAQKLLDYKSLESLQEYWLVSQDEKILNRFVRDQEDPEEWRNKTYSTVHEEIEFPTLGVKLKTKEIYKGIEFDAEEEEK
jgi:Uma2 family endonuclease